MAHFVMCAVSIMCNDRHEHARYSNGDTRRFFAHAQRENPQ